METYTLKKSIKELKKCQLDNKNLEVLVGINTSLVFDSRPKCQFTINTKKEDKISCKNIIASVCGYSNICVFANCYISARDASIVEADDLTQVYAHDSSKVTARYRSFVVGWDNSIITAYAGSSVDANGYSTVNAYRDSNVTANYQSTVNAYENSIIKVNHKSKITAYNRATIFLGGEDHKLSVKSRFVTVIKTRNFINSLDDWISYNNAQKINETTLLLYKRVNKEFKTQENTSHETSWKVGATLEHYEWNPYLSECGEGKFHACASPTDCDLFRTNSKDRYIALSVNVKDAYVWTEDTQYITKVAFRKGTVLYECDKNGNKITENENT